jgi:hypothetical protein
MRNPVVVGLSCAALSLGLCWPEAAAQQPAQAPAQTPAKKPAQAPAKKPAPARAPAKQPAQAPSKQPSPSQAKQPPSAPMPPPSPAARETYAAMPLAERAAIQSDLIWAGVYAGIIDGEFGNRSVAAVQAFQRRNNHAETGILTPPERAQLAALVKARQEHAGWRRIEDNNTGVTLGLPTKLVPQWSRRKDAARWLSATGDIHIETFRVSGPQVILANVAAQMRAAGDRKIEYDVVRPRFFVLTGTQGTFKFYARAHLQDQEVRGFWLTYDAAKDELMQPITVAMSNSFAPFSGRGTVQVGPLVRSRVEYTTGLIASAQGHILADRQATDGCKVITIPQVGPADRVADDAASGLALLRVNGVSDTRPVPLAGQAGSGNAVTLVGIADPRSQDGAAAVSTSSARLAGQAAGAMQVLEPAPPAGFSGAAAIDSQGRISGVLHIKLLAQSGPGPIDAQPVLVPADLARKFLRERDISLASGSAAVDAIKPSVVRVICIR